MPRTLARDDVEYTGDVLRFFITSGTVLKEAVQFSRAGKYRKQFICVRGARCALRFVAGDVRSFVRCVKEAGADSPHSTSRRNRETDYGKNELSR